MRPNGRAINELRESTFECHFIKHHPASVLISIGNTRVLCSASYQSGVPHFLKGQQQGWLTAEYGMLPAATHSRTQREAARGKQTGRTQEIQRLIGRALRTSINLSELPECSITLDCDVLQADGGTRTAAITGSSVALNILIRNLLSEQKIAKNPLRTMVSAVSVGIYQGTPILDLEYIEDSKADTDMNVIMDDQGRFVEIQGTAETQSFSKEELTELLNLAEQGNQQLQVLQKAALAK